MVTTITKHRLASQDKDSENKDITWTQQNTSAPWWQQQQQRVPSMEEAQKPEQNRTEKSGNTQCNPVSPWTVTHLAVYCACVSGCVGAGWFP